MVNRPAKSRLAVLATLLVAALTFGIVGASPAGADGTESDRTLTAHLKDSASGNTPVAGVEITVTGSDGDVFTGTTDDEGFVEIAFSNPVGTSFKVHLEESTLPDGAKLRPGAKTDLTISAGLSTVNVDFAIGPDNRDVQSKWDRIPASIYNGLLFGLIMAMAALGLSMIFGTTGLTNFAHGELVTLGAVCTFLLNTAAGIPFVLAVPMTLVVALGFGWFQNKILFTPLRHRGTGLIAMMIVTIGLQFLLKNFFAYVTGSRTELYDDFNSPQGHDFLGLFTYSWRDLCIAAVSIAVLAAVLAGLSFTRIGRATRAVADNPALAASSGINVDSVVAMVWIVGTALAALAGSFLAFQLGVTYQIGQLVLLLLFSAVCVGGLGSVWGALIGSLIIGVLIELSTLVIPTDLKNAGALGLLIVILLVRPQGILGRRERIG